MAVRIGEPVYLGQRVTVQLPIYLNPAPGVVYGWSHLTGTVHVALDTPPPDLPAGAPPVVIATTGLVTPCPPS